VVNQKQGVSALRLQRVLGFGSYQTAWAWLHKLYRAMVLPSRELLAGAVEIDESYVGGRAAGQAAAAAPGARRSWRSLWRITTARRGAPGWRAFPTSGGRR
jgi:hypothetical protein